MSSELLLDAAVEPPLERVKAYPKAKDLNVASANATFHTNDYLTADKWPKLSEKDALPKYTRASPD